MEKEINKIIVETIIVLKAMKEMSKGLGEHVIELGLGQRSLRNNTRPDN